MAEWRRRERRCAQRWSSEEGQEVGGYVEAGARDWGRFGLRSPRGLPQPHLQLRQRASFTSNPSSSVLPGSAGLRLVAEPHAEAQEVKPGPRRFAKLSKLLEMSSSSEKEFKEKSACEASTSGSIRPCGPRKTKT
jgi:hypothetical protein